MGKLGVRNPKIKKKKQNKKKKNDLNGGKFVEDKTEIQFQSNGKQASWFNETFHAVFGSVLSSLEMDGIPDDAIVELDDGRDHSLKNLNFHVKDIIGPSWSEDLCSVNNDESPKLNVEVGSPSVLIICSSAVRCVDFLRSLKEFTKSCKPAKLFAKHIKVEEQVSALKQRVNIAAGTPNRVRKLVDIGALGLSRLKVIILDMHKDAKGLNLMTVPEVRKEFWEVYKTHFHSLLVDSKLRICLY